MIFCHAILNTCDWLVQWCKDISTTSSLFLLKCILSVQISRLLFYTFSKSWWKCKAKLHVEGSMGKLVHMKRNFQKIYCLCDLLTECSVYVKKHFTQIDDIRLSFKQPPHFDSWHLFLCVCVFYVITEWKRTVWSIGS